MKINERAAQNFNHKAESLISSIKEKSKAEVKQPEDRKAVFDAHVTATIKPIGEITVGQLDEWGNEIAREFDQEGKKYTISGPAFQELKRICESIHRMKDFRRKVTEKLVLDLAFEWLKCRFRNEPKPNLTEYLIAEINERVRNVEVWIPIAWTRIQSSFEFGGVVFKTISREMVDRYEKEVREQILKSGVGERDDPKLDHHFERERKELLGLAAATVVLEGEPQRLNEIVAEMADRAISLLRCLYPLIVLQQYVSYSVPLGKDNLESYRYLIVEKDRIKGTGSGVRPSLSTEWRIDDKMLTQMKEFGMETLSSLLVNENRNDFQENILQSLLQYSQSSLKTNLNEKLSYQFVAIELVLRRSFREPIESLADRIALFAATSIKERKEVRSKVLKIYDMQPSLSLNSLYAEEEGQIKDFKSIVWTFFLNTIPQSNIYNTTKEFIDAIDNRLLSGGLEDA